MFCINIEISEFHQHPNYGKLKVPEKNWTAFKNDIAIVVLKSPFKVGSKVTVVEND